MILEVLKWPHKKLKTKCVAVSSFDSDLETLSRNMIETMDHIGAVGLSANQVGDTRKVAVIRIPRLNNEMVKEYHGIPIVLVNPEIIDAKGETVCKEGCASMSDAFDSLKRFTDVKIRYQNLSGELKEIEGSGLLAQCIQHELDHLNGITLVEGASRLRKSMIVRRLRKTGFL